MREGIMHYIGSRRKEDLCYVLGQSTLFSRGCRLAYAIS